MATTVQPTAGEATKQLINYRTDEGVGVIEMNDPPANTYTYEMNRQFDEAILKARKDAGKIGLPEVNLGVLPGTGGTQRLSRLVGKSKAIELMVTGNTYSFEEALELGIINDIYERDGFMENVMEYARQFCPPNK